MAWSTNPYCALADVKAALDLQNSNDDEWLQTLISEAQAEIDDDLGYCFQQTIGNATYTYSGNGCTQLWIDDCLSISQVQEVNQSTFLGADGIWVSGAVTTTDITADCVLLPENLTSGPFYLLERISGTEFLDGRRNYQVSGVWGQPSIPAPIARACRLLVIHHYKRRDATYESMTASPAYSPRRFPPTAMPEEVRCLIDHYRKHLYLTRDY